MALVIYVDESGDLGWNFSAPYRDGGSSRYLTIASLCVPSDKKHLPKRLIKDLYNRFKWPYRVERKWVDLSEDERTYFAESAHKLCVAHNDIHLHSITVNKQNVMAHIRQDGNKLYNYMIRLSLLNRMATHGVVTMVPDPRSIKVESGNSLHDYLQIELWFRKNAMTNLLTQPVESHNCSNLQFTDMLAGVIQARFEDNDSKNFQIIQPVTTISRLYFG
ncbi:MAG TPA: DUF3800 domain-containing protein [Verrucomicrobiae bacterium]|nr:DUF3800 domain-containing protein [Verrucomicrobiae bacterium]